MSHATVPLPADPDIPFEDNRERAGYYMTVYP